MSWKIRKYAYDSAPVPWIRTPAVIRIACFRTTGSLLRINVRTRTARAVDMNSVANKARLPRAHVSSMTTPMPPYSSSRLVTWVVTPIATRRSETCRKRFTRRRRMSSKPRKYWPMNEAVNPTASMWKK